MVFEDEARVLADSLVYVAVAIRTTVPAVIDGSRILQLCETATWGRDAGLALEIIPRLLFLETCRMLERILYFDFSVLFLFLLVPEITPALRDEISLLAKHGGHA